MSTGSDKTDCAHGGDPQWCQFCGRESALQADVTRLAAELAESVRALAQSRGEVERLRGEREGLYGEASYKMLREFHELACGQLAEARGDLERARGLLGRWVAVDGKSLGLAFTGVQMDTCAFLDPPTASPEVTVKEPRP